MSLKKKLLGGFLGTALAIGSVGAATAATSGTTSTSAVINAGSLSITAPTVSVGFPNVTLNGTTQTTSADLSAFTAGDATGTGNGWHVTVKATQWTDEAANTLPLGSLSLAAPSSATANGTTSPAPSIKLGPWAIDDGTTYTILSAALNAGMGNYDIAFPTTTATLTLEPATTYVDTTDGSSTYQSTVTWTIVSGP